MTGPSIGSMVRIQISINTETSHRTLIFEVSALTRIAPAANSQKKALCSRPNCWAEMPRSFIICTPPKARTALSAKLSSIKASRSSVTIQARRFTDG